MLRGEKFGAFMGQRPEDLVGQPRDPAHAWRAMPLVPVAVGLVIGMILDEYLPVPVGCWISGFSLVVGLYLCLRRYAYLRRHAVLLVLILGVSGLMLGGLWHHADRWRVPGDHILPALDGPSGRVTLRADVLDRPAIVHARRGRPDKLAGKGITLATVGLKAILIGANWQQVSGKVKLLAGVPMTHLRQGQQIRTVGRLVPVKPPGHIYQRRWDLYNQRSGIYFTLQVSDAPDIKVLGDSSTAGFTGLPRRLLGTLRTALTDAPADQELVGASLLEAMILGQRSKVEKSLNEAFVRCGVVHFLSVSGFHVAVLGLAIWRLCLLAGLSRRPAAIVVLAAILAYVCLAEPRPPLMRAAIIGALVCGAVVFDRPTTGFNWLAAALIILLLIRPQELFSAGFQLTFGSLLGIKLLTGSILTGLWRLVSRARSLLRHFWGAEELSVNARISRSRFLWVLPLEMVFSKILLTFAVGIAAWLVAIPIVAFHFNHLSIWGAINSVLLYPLVVLAMLGGFAKLIFSAIFAPLGLLLVPVINFITTVLSSLVVVLSKLPGTSISVHQGSYWFIAGYYLALLVIFFVPARRLKSLRLCRRHRLIPLILVVLCYIVTVGRIGPGADELDVHVLQGRRDELIVVDPPGRTALVFAGAAELGQGRNIQILQRFFAQRGIHAPGAIVLSSPGGMMPDDLQWLADQFRSVRLIVPQTGGALDSSISQWQGSLDPGGGGVDRSRILQIQPGQAVTIGDMRLALLWSPVGSAEADGRGENGLLVEVSGGGQTVLLAEDADARAYQFVCENYPQLAADCCVFAGKCEANWQLSTLLAQSGAQQVVYAARAQSRQQQRWQGLEAQLAEQIDFFNTAKRGAVRITIRAIGVHLASLGPK